MIINSVQNTGEATFLVFCSKIKDILSKYIGNLCEIFNVKCYKRKIHYILHISGCFE
jgi:hypothetical protein